MRSHMKLANMNERRRRKRSQRSVDQNSQQQMKPTCKETMLLALARIRLILLLIYLGVQVIIEVL